MLPHHVLSRLSHPAVACQAKNIYKNQASIVLQSYQKLYHEKFHGQKSTCNREEYPLSEFESCQTRTTSSVRYRKHGHLGAVSANDSQTCISQSGLKPHTFHKHREVEIIGDNDKQQMDMVCDNNGKQRMDIMRDSHVYYLREHGWRTLRECSLRNNLPLSSPTLPVFHHISHTQLHNSTWVPSRHFSLHPQVIVDSSPPWLRPYLQIIRLDKPTGELDKVHSPHALLCLFILLYGQKSPYYSQ